MGAGAPGDSVKSTGGIGRTDGADVHHAAAGRRSSAPTAVIFQLPDRSPIIEQRPRVVGRRGERGGRRGWILGNDRGPLIGCPLSSLTVPPMRPVCAAAGSAPMTIATTMAAEVARPLAARTGIMHVFLSYECHLTTLDGRSYSHPAMMPLWKAIPAACIPAVLRRTGVLAGLECGRPRMRSGEQAPAPAPFAGIDRVVEEAIAAKQTPGAVVLVGRGDAVRVREGVRAARHRCRRRER